MRREAKATAAQASARADTQRQRPSARPARLRRALLGVLALSLFAGVAQAQATNYTYAPLGSLIASGSGAGQFNAPRRIAVEQRTGDLFVADQGNDRIQVFSPDGNSVSFLTEFGAGTLDGPFGIAIHESGGETEVYVSDAGSERILRFDSDEEATPSFSLDAGFTSPAAGSSAEQIGDFNAPLAVDPTSGDLLVADRSDNLVKRFDDEGGYEGSFDGSSSPTGAFTGLTDVAVEADGDVLAVDSTGPIWTGGEDPQSPSRVERFGPTGSYVSTIAPLERKGFGIVTSEEAASQVVVGDVASAVSASVFSAGGQLLGGLGFFNSTYNFHFGTLTGVATSGLDERLYFAADVGLVAITPGIAVLKRVALPTPTIDPVDTGTVTATEATLTGTVNPEGVAAKWHFEYSEDGGTGGSAPVPDEDAGDGTTAEPASVDLSGLQPSTLYHVKLVATNSAGSVSSEEIEFETDPAAPVVTTRWAAPRTETTARLNGYVNALNDETTYFFEYGIDDSYGASVPASEDASIGEGRTPVLAAEAIGGLEPETTYHYRLVAENSAGRTNGDDMSFVTRGPSETGPPQRGTELVNSPDKGNQSVFAFDISPDSDKVLWGVPGGAPGSPAGAQGSFLAERTESGWKSHSVLPPVEELAGEGDLRYDLIASSSDFSEFLFDATQGLLSMNPHVFARTDSEGNQDIMPALPPRTDSGKVVTSKDLSHVFVNTEERFDPSHVEYTGNIYELGSGTPKLVSAMPGTNEAPECGIQLSGVSVTGFGGTHYPWVSDHGNRAYFEARPGSNCSADQQLYLRDLDTSTTTLVSGPVLSGPETRTDFVRTNNDGTKALYVTANVLDPDDHNTTRDIYLYTAGSGNECLTCMVDDTGLTPPGGADSEIEASEDLSRIYFISSKQLVPGQGAPNTASLYLLKNGQVHYISPTSAASQSFVYGSTPDGKTLIFSSDRPNITADDNGGYFMWYRYDDRDGSIECMSCPKGHPPTESISLSIARLSFSRHRSAVTDDGKSFAFKTKEALLPEDINGTDDIYEWRDGKLALVTDGETEFPGGIGTLELDAMSDNGANVLFEVGAQLTGHEIDNAGQLYVAHRGGGFPPPTSPPAPCREDACQGPLVPAPPLSSPASASFQGRGNVAEAPARKRCRAGKVRRKGRCVAKKKHRRKAACQKKRGKAKKRCVRAHKRHANKRHAKKVRGSK